MRTVQCGSCLRYRGLLQCDAFPQGIPEDILTGEFDHTKPKGSEPTFEPIPEIIQKSEAPERAFYDYTEPAREADQVQFDRVRKLAFARGYTEADFIEGGPLYGWSTNELLDLLHADRGA